jgi:alpha-tubulin suppressor-like RCC1 family protein
LPAAGRLDVSGATVDGSGHTCALAGGGDLRCWGFGGGGRLGYANESTIGDDETPGAVGPVALGGTATAISAGAFHTCGLLDGGGVRCWGFGGNGRLGYGNQTTIGDNETPASAGPVDVGGPVTAISAGGAHTCAVLQDASVRCWGFGGDGRLGYGDQRTIGDDETPQSVGPPVETGGSATAITTGGSHTCAVLTGGSVRCWGLGDNGRLGYGDRRDANGNVDTTPVGDNEKPSTVGPVDLGGPAAAITAGGFHTCALLVGGSVRCWGFGGNGRLGYGNTETIGDNETPGSAGPVDLGPDRKAVAISAGDDHTCALLEGGSVRCWGFGGEGRLGYGNTSDVGDDETPASVGPVDLGPDRKAVAISAGGQHTCALLDDDSIRCWGFGATGRLGYCNARDIGDDEAPGSVGPVNVTGQSGCPAAASPPAFGGGGVVSPVFGGTPMPASPGPSRAEVYRRALALQAARRRALGGCYVRVGRHAARERRNARRGSARRRARARRHIEVHRAGGRRACQRRYGRTPGRVGRLAARAVSRSKVLLSFAAVGTDGTRPPAARDYVIKQSRKPIRGSRAFARAQTLCRKRCRFKVTFVKAKLKLTVNELRPNTTYYYAIAARDNVSARHGPRSPTTKTHTPR